MLVLFEQHDHLRLAGRRSRARRRRRTARPSAPMVSPLASPGSQRSRWAGEPACSISAPASTLGRNGTGASERPSSSHRIDSSIPPSPCPPCSSLSAIPGQPSSHSSRPQRLVGAARLGVLAHALGPRPLCEQLTRGALDLALVVGEAEVHVRSLRRGLQPRQSQDALGDDVLEHLGRASLDRVAARAQLLIAPARCRPSAPPAR